MLERRPRAFRASAISESVPPSPWLSARSRMMTYFSVTTTISDQISSEATPTISSAFGTRPRWSSDSRIA